ncbi:MAG: T9SS type A sorting domain-containing protein, partial [Bacteroidota bacterium]
SINGDDDKKSVSVTAGATSYTLTLTITFANPDLNEPNPLQCTYEITVNQCGGFCTYTQGKYGNGSPACDGDGVDGTGPAVTYPTVTDMIKALLGVGGVPNELVLGDGGRTVTIPATASAAVLLNASMPGGGGSRELLAGNCTVDTPLSPCWTAGNNNANTYITTQGRINNVLLSQTITLGLNMRVSNSLSDFDLQAGTFATAKAVGGCGSKVAAQRSCYYDEYPHIVVVNEYTYKTISASVITALDNAGLPHTVGGLFTLANYALGNHDGSPLGQHTEYGAGLSEIQSAVAAINEGFDECRIFVGWDVAPCTPPADEFTQRGRTSVAEENGSGTNKLTVSAYPNPFRDKVNFVIASPVSGQATLEVFNLVGQKLQTVYKGYIIAGRNHVVEYKAPSAVNNSTLIYKLRIGNKLVTGKLLNLDN